ncbi:MAG: amidohydrolase family protein [Acidobacteriota bacterium]|nr:amidohydrolase family protein [Acidobacteriota bacterium]
MCRNTCLPRLAPLYAAAVCLLGATSALGADGRTVIHAGSLVDVEAGEVLGRHTIVVEGETITAVQEGLADPENGDTLIDLSGHTVLPGLMDMHVHLTSQQAGAASYLDRFQENPADLAIKGLIYAERTLLAGFTTVRDVGGETTAILAVRNAIARGDMPGPRIFAATISLASTGGHGDRTNGMRADLTGDPGPKEGIVNGVADARKAVRQRYKEGADLIKITATGGVLSLAKSGQNPQFTEEEMRAIVEAAKDYGFMVAAHAHGAEGMKRAIRAGVTTIEHGTYMDEEAFKLMKEHGTWFIPTISAGNFVAEKAAVPGYFPEIIRPKAAAIGPVIQETFAKAHRAGVPIAFGTDCGVCPHGSNAQEFLYMVEGGMAPMTAIQSATVVTAKLLDIWEETGSITAGKAADLIAVEGDPIADVTKLQDVRFVMRVGRIHKAPG